MGLTYKDAGVDIDAGDRLVDRIKPLAAATRRPELLGGIGGFAGLCGLPAGYREPVLVSGTDGVGTKLKLAFAADAHDTIGIDLVAMCVNDIVTVGAEPLFFLDYFATGRLDVDRGEAVVRGIAEGCSQAGCMLLGGETAELPGFYQDGEYDLAGFAVGVVEREEILDGKAVRAGDLLLGLASSGLHSNGYSLARRALLEEAKLSLDETPDGFDSTLGEALLRPTRIYVKAVRAALQAASGAVHALCHVTGGGIPGNLPRVLPEGLGADVRADHPVPPIFDLIAKSGGVELAEMRRTFNLGVGLVLAVTPDAAPAVRSALEAAGETVFELGTVVERSEEPRVHYIGEDAA